MNLLPARQPQNAFQMTSMLDVIFLLLCFFIASSIYSQWELQVDIQLPTAQTGKQPNRLPGQIIINLDREGVVTVNERVLSSEDLLLSPDELSLLRGLGIPLGMTLYADNTASLAVFDIRADLHLDPDAMLIMSDGRIFPFFYQDGRLTVWDSGSRAVFTRIT